MKLKILIYLIMISGWALAQQSPSNVAEVDFFNATRYIGSKNLARTTNGEVIVLFEPASNYTDGNQEIHYVSYNTIFGNWDPASSLSQSSDNATGMPSVVSDNQGNIYASWKELNGDLGHRQVMFSKFNGGLWSTPIVVSDVSNPGVNTINVASDGTLYIIFSVWNDPAVFEANIYVAKSTDDGLNWTTENLTSEFPTPDILPFNWMDVDIAITENGTVYAVWEDKAQEITNQYEILLSVYDINSGWSTPEIISPLHDGVPSYANYVDGVTVRDEAKSLYTMGPEDYVLNGKTSALIYDNGVSEVMSFLFNLYYILPVIDRETLVNDAWTYFQTKGVGSVLVVDDDNAYNNENLLYSALDNAEITYDTFDCGDIAGLPDTLPSVDTLLSHDLVIWFTGDEYSATAFWNTADTVNAALKEYLDTNGKNLWIIGRSFIFDKNTSYPVNFASGDFEYDYLGLASFDAQSKQDDDGIGVSILNLVPDNGILADVSAISWGNTGVRQGAPSIATMENTVFLAYDDDKDDHIMFKSYSNGVWSDPVQVDASLDTVSVTRPSIAVDENFGVYIIWQEVTSINETGIWGYNVFYATSPDGGVTWNDPVQLSNSSYINAVNESIRNANISRKVYKSGDVFGFNGGADVIWTEASESSSMGYYVKYANIPYVGTLTGIEDFEVAKFQLRQSYPNPFNAITNIPFTLPESGDISLKIFNTKGQLVWTIVQDNLESGLHNYQWNAQSFASGVYMLRLEFSGKVQTRKLVLLK